MGNWQEGVQLGPRIMVRNINRCLIFASQGIDGNPVGCDKERE